MSYMNSEHCTCTLYRVLKCCFDEIIKHLLIYIEVNRERHRETKIEIERGTDRDKGFVFEGNF